MTTFLVLVALMSSLLSTVGGLMLCDQGGSKANCTFGWFVFFVFMFASVVISCGARKL